MVRAWLVVPSFSFAMPGMATSVNSARSRTYSIMAAPRVRGAGREVGGGQSNWAGARHGGARRKQAVDDPAQQEQIRTEIAVLTAQVKELRREVKLCGDIALRSTSIKDKIQAAREEVSGRDEKARQEPEQGRAAPPGRR